MKAALPARLRDTASATSEALRNPAVRRVQAAFMLGVGADAALMVALAVAAFNEGGPAGVALIGAARMLPMIAFGLLSSAPVARWRPDHVLMALTGVRGAAAVAAVWVLAGAGPIAVAMGIAAVLGAATATVTPVQYAILPALARSPRELVVANIATSSAESLGSFAGPLIAGGCIALGASWLTGVVAGSGLALEVGLLLGLTFENQEDARPERPAGAGLGLGQGLRAIKRRPYLALIILGFSLQTMVRAALAILLVILSIEILRAGEAAVGYLTAAIGLGGAVGMIGGLTLRGATVRGFVLALVGWGLPMCVIGLIPLPLTAVAGLLVIGGSNALLDVIGYTLLQRSCRNEDRAPVMAILEAGVGGGALVGSLVTPTAILLLGAEGALVAFGAVLPLVAVLLFVLSRRFGAMDVVSGPTIDSLRRVPAFRALPLTGLERLALSSIEIGFGPGEVLMAKGEEGDRFLLIEAGDIEISDGGRVLGLVGPGAGIGEIALLRGGPRTATARALTAGTALAFDAAVFRAAVAGPAASAAAERLVEERLAHSRTDPLAP